MDALAFGPLRYLYTGVKDFQATLTYYVDVLGARLVWKFNAFDAWVAAVDVGMGPYILLADHRPPGTTIPVIAVKDLEGTVAALSRRGWKKHEGPFGLPDGPCYTFEDPSGNRYALLEEVRPRALEEEYAASSNRP